MLACVSDTNTFSFSDRGRGVTGVPEHPQDFKHSQILIRANMKEKTMKIIL